MLERKIGVECEMVFGGSEMFIRDMKLSMSSFFFQAEDGIRVAQESRGLGDVYKRQAVVASPGAPFVEGVEVKASSLCSHASAHPLILSLIHI